MIRGLKQWVVDWAIRQQQREVNRMHSELVRLKTEVFKNNCGQPIRLTPEERQRLNELRQTIDPETLEQIDVLSDAE